MKNTTSFSSRKVKALRDERKKAGLCPNCGGAREDEHIQCAACRKTKLENLRKFYDNHPAYRHNYHAKHADSINQKSREYRQEKTKAGICWMCSARPSEDGSKLCHICIAKRRKASARYNQRESV